MCLECIKAGHLWPSDIKKKTGKDHENDTFLESRSTSLESPVLLGFFSDCKVVTNLEMAAPL